MVVCYRLMIFFFYIIALIKYIEKVEGSTTENYKSEKTFLSLESGPRQA